MTMSNSQKHAKGKHNHDKDFKLLPTSKNKIKSWHQAFKKFSKNCSFKTEESMMTITNTTLCSM